MGDALASFDEGLEGGVSNGKRGGDECVLVAGDLGRSGVGLQIPFD